jgi:hypothetical protein
MAAVYGGPGSEEDVRSGGGNRIHGRVRERKRKEFANVSQKIKFADVTAEGVRSGEGTRRFPCETAD